MEGLIAAINHVFRFVTPVSDWIWDFPTNYSWWSGIPILGSFSLAVILLMGSGIYFTIRLCFVQAAYFRQGVRLIARKRSDKTGISPGAAFFLSTAMRVGPGNIIGVTGAIATGGPGALFWMWVSAFFGMATAFVESTLAQIFKRRDGDDFVGGLPFYGRKLLKNSAAAGVFLSVLYILYALCCFPAQGFNTITAVGSIVLQTSVNALGSIYVSAVATGGKIYQLLSCPFDAMGAAMATYCGQNVGAGELDRLNRGVRSCSLLGLCYSVAAFGAMLLFAPQCAMLFLNSGEPQLELLVGLTTQYIVTLTAFFFPLALVNILRFSIQGMGFGTLAILAGVLEMIARTVVGHFFVPLAGYTAACFASPAAWICADLFLIPACVGCIAHLKRRNPTASLETLSRTVVGIKAAKA